MLRNTLCALALSAFVMPWNAADARIAGSCENYEFTVRTVDPETNEAVTRKIVAEDGTIAAIIQSRIIEAATPVYTDPQLSGPPIDRLLFDTRILLGAVRGSAIQAKTLADEVLGWVPAQAVLCQFTPATSPATGLEQKFFVRTETAVRGEEVAAVQSYPTSKTEDCGDRQCRELSRFATYYVFAQDTQSKRLLLGDSFRIGERGTLIGWVSEDDGILWETNYGFRPQERLVIPAGQEGAGEERAICIYPSVADALLEQKCQPLLGGMRWYKYSMRAPILGRAEEDSRFLKVVLPVAGKAGNQVEDAFEVAMRMDQGVEQIRKLENIDVFFLIDGTKSMQPYIDQIVGRDGQPGFVQQVLRLFATDPNFQGARLRFAYRIYRDTYAGAGELGESLPFSRNCDAGMEELQRDQQAFQRSLQQVRASRDDEDKGDDDLEENLFGGLIRSLEDIYTCADNQKVLFVIGDHGYNAQNQMARGKVGYEIDDIADFLAGTPKLENFKPIVTFFVQTQAVRNDQNYRRAYDLFSDQGRQLVSTILENHRKRLQRIARQNGSDNILKRFKESSPSDFVLRLNDERETLRAVVEGLQGFANTRVLNEVIADLRGGAGLVAIIERLQGSERYQNLPGLAWDIIAAEACKALGEACYQQVFDTILSGVVKDNDEIIEDVWLTEDHFRDWMQILRAAPDMSQFASEEMLRDALLQNLVTALGKVIDLSMSDTEETLATFLRRAAKLPFGSDSRLLSYSLADLADEGAIPTCEIINLIRWLNDAKSILEIINSGQYPEVQLGSADGNGCPVTRPLPRLAAPADAVRFPENDMSFAKNISNTRVWWVPRAYLP